MELRKERTNSPDFTIYFCDKMDALLKSVTSSLEDNDKKTAELKVRTIGTNFI